MTTLAGIELNNSLFLDGVENERKVIINKFRTLDGESRIQAKPKTGGRPLRLTTVSDDGAITGIFCQNHIDALKPFEATGIPVLLVDRYNRQYIVVLEKIDVTQLNQREPISPTKKWVGSISMTEV